MHRILSKSTASLLAAFVFLALAGPAFAQPTEQKLTASDGETFDLFGGSVSISGDVLVVGAYGDDDNSGSAYVYNFVGGAWAEEQKLTASDGAASDHFGRSVSISGGVAMVGAYGDGGNSGSAYVYRYVGGTWTEEQKLTASDGAASDDFGISVSISGDVAIVGAFGDDDNGAESGSAYVYRYVGGTWTEEQKLTASDGAASDDFGISVSISGDVVVVGAPEDDDNGTNSGSVYVYRYVGGTWTEEQKLAASDAGVFGNFGWSVSISGDVAVLGSYVYRYVGGAWTEEQKLTASDETGGNYFGRSAVSISGDVAVAGAPADDDNGIGSGAAYVFAGLVVAGEPGVLEALSALEIVGSNPSSESTALRLTLSEASPVGVSVLDMLGRELKTERHGWLGAGTHQLILYNDELVNGTYVAVVRAGNETWTRLFTVIR